MFTQMKEYRKRVLWKGQILDNFCLYMYLMIGFPCEWLNFC